MNLFISSLALSVGLSWTALNVFPKLGLMDRPHKYGLDRAPIPYPGGVAIAVAVIALIISFLPIDRVLGSVILATLLLAVTCFIDDRMGLPPALRLAIQFIAGAMLVFGGIGIESVTNPLGGTISLGAYEYDINIGNISFTLTLLADILTVIWVMVMVNAFNWIDGVPGMASSVAATSSFVMLLLSSRADHYVDQTLAIALSTIILGVSLGFLIFDFPKPKMIMGDTGSMILGFLLAVTAIISGGKIATAVLVLGFPILDFTWVILRRLAKGTSPFKGDLWHFHHRLLRAGLSEQKVVIFFASSSLIFGAMALLLHTEGKVIVFGAIFAFMVLLAGILYYKK